MKNQLSIYTIIFIIAFNVFPTFANAQKMENPLANTEWEGIANIPTPETVTFQFAKDVFNLKYQGQVVEEMKYTIEKDQILLSKSMGNSPCATDSKGVYKFKIDKKTLNLIYVSDECTDRKTAFDVKNFTKVEMLK